MEKNNNKRIETYVTGFKDNIRCKITELEFQEKQKINELLEYAYDYNRLVLTKEDFVKRKRVKNAIPTLNRCNARRANGEQCTRQRKEGCEFCGTHNKGVPHGFMSEDGSEQIPQTTQKLEVMRKNEIDCFDLKDGQLMYTKKNVKKPITKKNLVGILANFYGGDVEKAVELNEFIMENREEVVKESIVRKVFKSEI